jgi:hypothetical protein
MIDSFENGVARKKKTAAAIANRKIAKVVRIKNFGGVEYLIPLEYRRSGLFFHSLYLSVIELMQYLRRLGGGPSLNTCPK